MPRTRTAGRVLVGALAMGMAMGPVGLTSAHAAEPVPSDTTGIQATQNLTPFEGSYWYVPRAYLPAYLHQGDGKPVVRIPDQTLWHFTDSADGYLLGCSYRSIDGGASWSPSAIVGSIAPDNSVQFGFYGEILTVGSGSLVGSRGRQTFLMQVSTGPASGGVTHWAYMVRARPGSPQWTSLPGTNGDSIASVDTGCVSPSSATPASG